MNRRSLLRSAGALFAAGALVASSSVLAACGGDDDDDDAASTPTTNATTAATMGGGEVFKVGDIEISNVTARASTTETSAVYMQIKSTGAADRLLSATTTVANETQVHETVMDGSSMKMNELKDGLAIPAGGMVELKTGSYHVMMMGLKEELKEGDTIKVTLKFEKAGTIEITAPIKPITGTMR